MNHSNNSGLLCYCSSLKTGNAAIVFMVSITTGRDRNSVPHFNNGKTLRNSFCSLQKFYEKKDKWNKNIYELVRKNAIYRVTFFLILEMKVMKVFICIFS